MNDTAREWVLSWLDETRRMWADGRLNVNDAWLAYNELCGMLAQLGGTR